MKSNIFNQAKINGVDLDDIAEQFDLKTRFNKRAVDEAQSAHIKEGDYWGREDFTAQTTFTIDGDDSRDFDDAVSIQKHSDGTFTLKVHIADVAHYVKQGSALDKEAFRRGTSVYFPFGCFPMLPANLSDNICSLKPYQDRLTLSVIMELDQALNITKTNIVEGVINSSARLTYNLVQRIFDQHFPQNDQISQKESAKIAKNDQIVQNQNSQNQISQKESTQEELDYLKDLDKQIEYLDKKVIDDLLLMHDLAQNLIKKRIKNGSIDLESTECEFTFDPNGKAKSFQKRPRLFSHRLIEEFMILANEAVARKIAKKTPFLFRIHDQPSPQKSERFAEFLTARNIPFDFDDAPTIDQLKSILENATPEIAQVLSVMILRTMSKAVYSPTKKHHFGLNLDNYCHFTSPIRRYPDLFIHRVIKSLIASKGIKNFSKGIDGLADHCSQTERLADEAERKVDDIMKAECMRKFIGEEFDGTISGVTDFGVFVQLPNTAEGLIRIENLPGYLIFDKTTSTLSTRDRKSTYRLGDPLKIKIASVRMGKIEFLLAK